jgi:hypothetical protein
MQSAPVWVRLEQMRATEDRTPAVGIPLEDAVQTTSHLLCNFEESHVPSRAGRALHLEAISVIHVVLQQRAQDQRIDRHPDRPAPVGVAAKHARRRFGGLVPDGEDFRPEAERYGASR